VRRYRYTVKDRWVFTLTISGGSATIAPPNMRVARSALRDLRLLLPLKLPADNNEAVRLHERHGDEVARILAAIVKVRERVDLEWEEIRP
jgi:hypothetical protein